MGFTAARASDLMAFQSVGHALGSFAGGRFGDLAAACSPHHGRTFMGQACIFSGMVLMLTILAWIPRSPEYFGTYAVSFFAFGFSFGPLHPGVDRVIWSEIVSADCRGTIVSWWTFVAGSSGQLFGAPLVGWLAETVLGYRPSSELDARNTQALSKALVLFTAIPWTLMLCCYTAMHCTYSRDIAMAAAEARHEGSQALPKVIGAAVEAELAEGETAPLTGEENEEEEEEEEVLNKT